MQLLPLNTPMSGRFSDEVKSRLDLAARPKDFLGDVDKSSKGRAYNIFNKYGLYDVDDSPYLTTEQKNSVPEDDRTIVSDYIDAIVDTMRWILVGDYNDGPVVIAQDMIDKTLIKAMSADARAQSISKGVSVIPGMQWVEAASQTMSSMTSLMAGLPPFHPDILPSFNFNLPRIPLELDSFLPDSYFSPDWLFISKYEYSKRTLYDNGNPRAGVLLGYGIDLFKLNENTASQVFAPFTVSPDGGNYGDLLTGLSSSQYGIVLDVVNRVHGDDKDRYLDLPQYSNLVINRMQSIGSFIRWNELTLWSQMKNKSNYLSAHWGMATKNTCPSSVRTAVVSYIMNHGTKIDNNTPFSAFISYLLTMGMYYQNGYDNPVVYTPISEEMLGNVAFFDGERRYKLKYKKSLAQPSIIGDSMQVNSNTPVIVDKIPRNAAIADKYFMLLADIIGRRSYAVIDGISTSVQRKFRERRVAEANLIFSELLEDSEIKFGEPYSNQPDEQTPTSLRSRGLGNLVSGKVFRYDSNPQYGTETNGIRPNQHVASYGLISESAYQNDIFLPHVSCEFPTSLKKISYWINTIINDIEAANEDVE